MDRRIVFFDVVYYGITALFITQLTENGGGSLGPMVLLLIFWGVALIVLVILLARGTMPLKTAMDKTGVFMATPVLPIAFLIFLFPPVGAKPFCREEYFEQNKYEYLKKTCDINGTGGRRVEYYLRFDSINSETQKPIELLVKDSTWVWLSPKRDTIKTVIYRNGINVN